MVGIAHDDRGDTWRGLRETHRQFRWTLHAEFECDCRQPARSFDVVVITLSGNPPRFASVGMPCILGSEGTGGQRSDHDHANVVCDRVPDQSTEVMSARCKVVRPSSAWVQRIQHDLCRRGASGTNNFPNRFGVTVGRDADPRGQTRIAYCLKPIHDGAQHIAHCHSAPGMFGDACVQLE